MNACFKKKQKNIIEDNSQAVSKLSSKCNRADALKTSVSSKIRKWNTDDTDVKDIHRFFIVSGKEKQFFYLPK